MDANTAKNREGIIVHIRWHLGNLKKTYLGLGTEHWLPMFDPSACLNVPMFEPVACIRHSNIGTFKHRPFRLLMADV